MRLISAILCLAALASSIPAQEPDSQTTQEKDPLAALDAMARDCYLHIGPALAKSEGKLTPALRNAYLTWAQDSVFHGLQKGHQTIAPECLSEVSQDAILRDAMFAAVYPPDPSIIQNYAALRQQLGPAFTKKYRSLAIGIAVARRVKGVEPDASGIGRENQAPNWAYNPLRGVKEGSERKYVQHIADFMKAKGCSALDLFNSADLRTQLIDYISRNDDDPRLLAEIGRTVDFGEHLKSAMILLGQRPARRTPQAGTIEWLKYLVSVYETGPSSVPAGMSWPIFPIQTAPWPLLMPFSHSIPMDEAKYLWEAFQGVHGDDRFHSYGPYREDLDTIPDSLRPSHWFWNAVPDQIVHGGECMPISLATRDLYAALGKPAGGASQPGHANLISYASDNGTWRADIEQDFAGGPPVTQSQWYFDDDHRSDLSFQGAFGWPFAEYHLGLAVGMNLGVTSYVDTRIAARIFDVLPKEQQPKLGAELLRSAILENPFNAELWYRLANVTSGVESCIALLQDIKNHDPARLLAGEPSPSFAAFLKSGKTGPVGYDMDSYWSNLSRALTHRTLVAQGAPKDEAGMHAAYAFLRTLPGLQAADFDAFTHRYTDIKRPETEKADIDYDRKLADGGDTYGLLRMGQRYLDGDGLPRDDGKARDYLVLAASKGEPAAAVALEPISTALPLDGTKVTASSQYSGSQKADHLIVGAGMTGGVHDNDYAASSMWQTVDNPPATVPAPGLPVSPAWVRFDFPQPRTFDSMQIWNHNQLNLTDRGFNKFTVYATTDLKHWYPITKDAKLPRASGTPFDPGSLVQTNSTGRLIRAVIIAAAATDGNFGSHDYGLSQVRFLVHSVTRSIPSYQIQVHACGEFSPGQSANHLIDGAGMIGEFHDNNDGGATMWFTQAHTIPTTPAPYIPKSPAWVRFNFSVPRFVDQVRIWNENEKTHTDGGFQMAHIYGTSDGINWFVMTSTDTIRIPRATGAELSSSTTYFNVSPERPLRSVIIAADPVDGDYGNGVYGLAAVRFILADPADLIAAQ